MNQLRSMDPSYLSPPQSLFILETGWTIWVLVPVAPPLYCVMLGKLPYFPCLSSLTGKTELRKPELTRCDYLIRFVTEIKHTKSL